VAVPTRVTTLPVHSPVPVQVVSSWILGKEVAKVKSRHIVEINTFVGLLAQGTCLLEILDEKSKKR